ncbi:MAG: hypothetical protein ACR2HV_04270 [Acidimicrobiales bacterium]
MKASVIVIRLTAAAATTTMRKSRRLSRPRATASGDGPVAPAAAGVWLRTNRTRRARPAKAAQNEATKTAS